MLKITQRGKEELRRLSLSTGDKPGGVMRLVAGHFGRLQFVKDYDEDFSCDQVIADEGETILLVDNKLAETLDGVTIDYQTARGGLCLLRDENPDPI